MDLKYEIQDRNIVIYLKGELGNFEARKVMEEIEVLLLLHKNKNVLLDLSSLSFMDSSGIAVIMKIFKNTKGKREFTVQNTPNLAMKIFNASGVLRFVNFA